MQRIVFRISAFALLFQIIGLLSACQKSDDNNPTPGSGPTPASGLWMVSSLISNSGDETGNYTNYTFDFASDGKLTATNGSQSWTGTWATGVDDSKNKFVINFSGSVPSALEELKEDWLIIEMSSTGMHFQHTSGGNGTTEVLKFTKI